ncbi:uncharacterized protein LOC141668383 [Apium graveolens]|uniref:uncharacterized protein LOC141668383 n=1 Tax=Apium graveolens TaxID=4045 RepID=UPI003D7AC70A
MFWKLASLSASSPVELVLDKDNFTLEELLDEEEIIQECKALNSRLINFLRDRAQVKQLLQYIINEPPQDAESTRIFKFPFIACEIFTCEIDVILKTLVEEEELMELLFSFLDPTRSHTALLAGYFSKVVICLMMRKTIPLMNYVQSHQHVFEQLVDLIGITSIMEVLIRLVGGDDHMFPNSLDVMHWLANSNLLEMIVDKLSPLSSPEVHANAAETLCAITRNLMSPLNTKLSSSSFVARILGHALEDSNSKSALVHSLSVCISMLDPKRSFPSPFIHSFRSHVYEAPVLLNPETVGAMLPKLGDLLMLLNVSSDEKVLPTTYGELRPPLGKYRLKIVEFIAVLLKIGNEVAEKDLVSSGTIQRVLDLFFEYPYNNALHHHVESIIFSCLESKNITIVDHVFQECGLVLRILQTNRSPTVSGELNQPTIAAAGRCGPRLGNLGHITRISNKLVQLGKTDSRIQVHLQDNSKWDDWQVSALQERNLVENVYHWACGRPTALHDRTRDSDDDDIQDRDYDVAALANNLSQAFRYSIYDNNDSEEGQRVLDHDEEDGYFDDESTEIVMSSLRLGDDQGRSLFTNSNWFAFQDDGTGAAHNRQPEAVDDINLGGASNGGSSSSDDEVVVGEEELPESQNPADGISSSATTTTQNGLSGSTSTTTADMDSQNDKSSASGGTHLGFKTSASDDLFGNGPIPDSMGCGYSNGLADRRPSLNPFEVHHHSNSGLDLANAVEKVSPPVSYMSNAVMLPNGTLTSTSSETSAESNSSQRTAVAAYSLFEEDVEFVGVELEGTEKAMEQALKEGSVGEAGPLKRNSIPMIVAEDNSDDSGIKLKEFNDANYWRVDQEVAVLE